MLNKISTKALLISSLVIGVSACAFAGQDDSITAAMKNQQDVSNVAMDSHGRKGGDSDSNGDNNSNDHSGNKGRGGGGEDKGGKKPPECVPEPCSMLALGAGAGIMAIRRKLKKA